MMAAAHALEESVLVGNPEDSALLVPETASGVPDAVTKHGQSWERDAGAPLPCGMIVSVGPKAARRECSADRGAAGTAGFFERCGSGSAERRGPLAGGEGEMGWGVSFRMCGGGWARDSGYGLGR